MGEDVADAGAGSGWDDDTEVPGPEKILGTKISEDPAMVVFQNFVSQAEVEFLLRICEGRWEQSQTTQGAASNLYSGEGKAAGEDATSETRTSMSVHLDFDESVVVERIAARVAAVAGATLDRVEPLAVLKYEPGQYFKQHHDGAFRSSTVFVYFNDVEEGGETYFPNLEYKVRPLALSAVLWHNRLPSGDADMRLLHEALPVGKGTKYGMNCFVGASPIRDASHVRVEYLTGAETS